ncbi:MAG: hypothetical protein AAF587_39195 [Bacteroidota bacterium]
MQKTIVGKLYVNLDKKLHEQFQAWIQFQEPSPESLLILSEALFQKDSKEHIQQSLQIDDDRALTLLRNKLLDHLKLFLAYLELKEDKANRAVFFLKKLRRLANPSTFLFFWEHIKKGILPTDGPKTAKHQFLSYQLYTLAHETGNHVLGEKKESALKYMFRSLNTWWMYEQAIMIMARLTFHRFDLSKRLAGNKRLPRRIESGDMKTLEKNLRKYAQSKGPKAAKILFRLIEEVESKQLDIPAFVEMLEGASASVSLFEKEDLINMFNFIYSYLAVMANRSAVQDTTPRKAYYLQVCELYDWAFRHRLLIYYQSIHPSHYNNIATAFFQTDQLEHGYEILKQLKKYLPKKSRKAHFAFYTAQYYFLQQDYERAQQQLPTHLPEQKLLQFKIRFMHLQIAYEREDNLFDPSPQLEREASSTYEALRRQTDQLSRSLQQPYMNFVRLFQKLLKAHSSQGLQALHREVLEVNGLTHSEWLILKVEEKLRALPSAS